MYAVADTLPVDQLDSGSFLLSGPAMSGKYELLLELLVGGLEAGDGGLFVTTNEDAADVLEDVEDRLGSLPEQFRVVDCVSERQGGGDRFPEERVEYVSSPADLTGVGIGFSEQLRRFAEAGLERTRVGFYSISTLLMYADVQTVFRAMHVMTGRVDSVDGLGLFAMDPTVHEESTTNTIKQLFDGMIELREGDDGPEVRLVGVSEATGEWVSRA